MKNLTAQDVMQPEQRVRFLTLSSTYQDAKEFTLPGRFSNYNFPLVDDNEKRTLLGLVKRQELLKLVANASSSFPTSFSQHSPQEAHSLARAHRLELLTSEDSTSLMSFQEESLDDIPDEFQPPSSRGKAHQYLEPTGPPLLPGHVRKAPVSAPNSVSFWQQPIPFVFTNSDIQCGFGDTVIVDPTPFQVAEKLSLSKVHFIFTMLGLRDVCVTHRGHFVGIITKQSLWQFLK